MDLILSNDFVVMVLIPIILVLLGYVQEHGFENLISQPIIEQWLKKLKPFQPYIVTVVGIVLAYVSKQVGVDMVPDLAPYLDASGDVGTVLAGLAISVVSMIFHDRRAKQQDVVLHG